MPYRSKLSCYLPQPDLQCKVFAGLFPRCRTAVVSCQGADHAIHGIAAQTPQSHRFPAGPSTSSRAARIPGLQTFPSLPVRLKLPAFKISSLPVRPKLCVRTMNHTGENALLPCPGADLQCLCRQSMGFQHVHHIIINFILFPGRKQLRIDALPSSLVRYPLQNCF